MAVSADFVGSCVYTIVAADFLAILGVIFFPEFNPHLRHAEVTAASTWLVVKLVPFLVRKNFVFSFVAYFGLKWC